MFDKTLLAVALLASKLTNALKLERTDEEHYGLFDIGRSDVILHLAELGVCGKSDSLTLSGYREGGQTVHRGAIAKSMYIHGVGSWGAEAWFDVADMGCVADPGSPYCSDQTFFEDLNAYLLDVDSRYDDHVDNVIDDLMFLQSTKVWISDETLAGDMDDGAALAHLYETNEHAGVTRVSQPVGDFADAYTNEGAALLRWFYGDDPNVKPDSECPYEHGLWHKFYQSDYYPMDVGHGLNDYGWIYIPDDCYVNDCHLHFALHDGDERHILHENHFHYENYAARNHVIVVEALSLDGWSFEHESEHDDNSAHGRYMYETMSTRDPHHLYYDFFVGMGATLLDCAPQTDDFHTPIFLTFENPNSYAVDVHWFNDEGATIKMGTIEANGGSETFNTWSGAPWTMTDPNRDTIEYLPGSDYFQFFEDATIYIPMEMDNIA